MSKQIADLSMENQEKQSKIIVMEIKVSALESDIEKLEKELKSNDLLKTELQLTQQSLEDFKEDKILLVESIKKLNEEYDTVNSLYVNLQEKWDVS